MATISAAFCAASLDKLGGQVPLPMPFSRKKVLLLHCTDLYLDLYIYQLTYIEISVLQLKIVKSKVKLPSLRTDLTR